MLQMPWTQELNWTCIDNFYVHRTYVLYPGWKLQSVQCSFLAVLKIQKIYKDTYSIFKRKVVFCEYSHYHLSFINYHCQDKCFINLGFMLCSYYFKITKGLFSTLCFFEVTILPISEKEILPVFNQANSVLKPAFKGVPWNNFWKVS